MKVAYFSEGSSLFDSFWISRLGLTNSLTPLTFKGDLRFADGLGAMVLPQPVGSLPVRDGIRRLLGLPIRVFQLRRALSFLNPDVLVVCKAPYGLNAALAGFKPTVVILWASDVLLPRRLLGRAILRYVVVNAGLIVVDSAAQVEACRRLGCSLDRIVNIPWVDVKELLPREKGEGRSGFRRRYGWSSDDLVVVCTRKHAPVYDIETILKSVPLVLEGLPQARFLFIGDGPSSHQLRGLASTMGLGDSVRFSGPLPHEVLLNSLRNSDIYVSSSLSDGSSASLVEAMAAPLPCVVTDIPGNRPWVSDGVNGRLFPVKDSTALARTVLELAGDSSQRERLATEARQTVMAKADWDKNYASLETAMKRLVRAG
jgi:glycosyltransferase involved in cell wall biosynthesis